MGWMSAAAGAAIDRRDGDSGIKGAVLGMVAGRAMKASLPVAAAATIGWIAFKAFRRTRRG
jgi:hypothetical protein